MAMKALYTYLFLILLATVVVVQSKPHIASQVVYHKLEDALISDSSLLYLMQEIFIPSKILPHNLVHLNVCVTVGNVQYESYDNSSLPGGQCNFTYRQNFQWSSSGLVDLISVEQSADSLPSTMEIRQFCSTSPCSLIDNMNFLLCFPL